MNFWVQLRLNFLRVHLLLFVIFLALFDSGKFVIHLFNLLNFEKFLIFLPLSKLLV